MMNNDKSMPWPDWADNYRLVRMTMPDGREVVGRLCASEWITTDQHEEIPQFTVRAMDGHEESFGLAQRWEYLEPRDAPDAEAEFEAWTQP
jgi:hypothetical protein